MPVNQPRINALIVDDDPYKIDQLRAALVDVGGFVVATAGKAFEVADLYEAGEITPQKVDVAFIDSDLGSGPGGGKEVLRYLFGEDNCLIRRPFGTNNLDEIVLPDPNRIVTVGSSSNPDWAQELGSYSDILKRPLTVNWGARPLNLQINASVIRHLKQIT